ncbi:AfsR/SARP family transcriptional regulator [Anaerotruncus rubiinfantis]|jgi:DNA-binding SARP family transcriptional activator|uniref:AfsR/SARP family transcriptional regulator n=1 Tax=Anaerotruncus rubiinfantis TaxID=1720200 RepID=UPI0008326126|nr:BTAD domain-containing putative transcriptional regulator [Anaerotruncus rubiinfantis]
MDQSVQPPQDNTIYISMLGGFKLTVQDKVLSDTLNRTHQLWNLLEYLIAFRNKTVSQDELIEALWPNDGSENPANALKNLIYRIRNLFTNHEIPFAKEIIIFHRGSYRWNNQLPCVVDIEEFEKTFRIASDVEQPSEFRIEQYRKALDLYKGDFLPGSNYEEWVVPLTGYYRSIYFKCVYEAIRLLIKQEKFDDIRIICEQAIVIDPFEEGAHKHLIHALVKQNKQSEALAHYNYVTDLFYRELGVRPSDAMRNLYREIVKSVNNVETDLGIIKEDLSERNAVKGAFYCDYEVFKNMYRLEARTATRTGQSVFIGLITVTNSKDEVPDPQTLSRIMDQLLETLRTSLRRGDVISRFSSTQYVLMLPTLTYENGEMVISRICKKFRSECKLKDVKLHTTLQPLDPIL